jgi:hypothetical protein
MLDSIDKIAFNLEIPRKKGSNFLGRRFQVDLAYFASGCGEHK